ncbi:MAG: dihydroorotate dehydrogenase electron transfer subunit [Acidobacteriota bacterium]
MRSDHPAVLLRTRTFAPSLYSATFSCPELARAVQPGQFVMLDVPDRIRPYLRRAYSVADAVSERGEVEFLVKTIGPGTAALETLPPGSPARLLGPLGNAFSVEDLPAGSRVAVVAGGIGAAPFPLLFRALASAGIAGDFYFGGRSAADVALAERFAGTFSGDLHVATNDGSQGERGFVTDLFARRAEGVRYARVFACGPMAMFGALARVVSALSIPAEFSTEAAMGCGFGVCLACVIPARNTPYLISCREGPILSPERIDWSLAG